MAELTTALITGASSGLGEKFAYALARRRYSLVLTARRQERLDTVAARATELGSPGARAITSNLAVRGEAEALCQRLREDHIEIDYLVNNAGFGTTGRFDRLALNREIEEIDLNITAVVALTRLLLPSMLERRAGTIINVASTAAFQAVPFMATYAATKAFVLSFSEGLAGELAGTGVHVLALCPGPVKTEFQRVAGNEKGLIPSFAYLDAESVVEQGIAAAATGRNVCITGALNFVTAQSTRFLPRALINRIARRIYRDIGQG